MESTAMDQGRLADKAALTSLENKLQLVRDRVTSVATGYLTGLYVYGAGGLGKSYTVLRHLDAMEASYKLFNSRMTAKGLFRALEKAPDAIHVLEDLERLTKDPDAQSLLRAALWAQPGQDRVVPWTTDKDGERHFSFRGGIILLANKPLANLPELQALGTRITVLRLEVTDAELAAQMRELAAQGYTKDDKKLLDPARCKEVAEYLIAECRTAGYPLDLRLLENSYKDYLQWASDMATHGWQNLVSSRVREAVHHLRCQINTMSREERRRRRRCILRGLLKQTADQREQLRLYEEWCKELDGGSRADFFNRLREVKSGEFDGEEDTAPP
jgi:hypothetical protein